MSEPEGAPELRAAIAAARDRMATAARRAGRDPSEITLIAATKTVPVERLRVALAAGLFDLGENRAQELLAKADALAGGATLPRWHFLGMLQRNKVRALAPLVSCWHSVDRPELGDEISRHAPGASVLVEVNLAGEPQKGGCAPADVAAVVDHLRSLGLDALGLMTVPPHPGDPRPWFVALRTLRDRLGLAELSMGMTDDFEIAVEEGATMVRIGRAIFGPRPPRGAASSDDAAIG